MVVVVMVVVAHAVVACYVLVRQCHYLVPIFEAGGKVNKKKTRPARKKSVRIYAPGYVK